MSGYTSFLILFTCVSILVAIVVYFIKKSDLPYKKEGFAVYACPSDTNSFVNDDGETLCCNGDVVDGYCTGNLKCTLSPKTKTGLPTCKDLAASDASSAGANKCPRSMSNYFARLDGSLKGCSESQPTPDGTAPSDPNKPQCILYPTQALDEIKLDSCFNVVRNASRAAECAAAEATAALPACAAAAAAANAPTNANSACPTPPEPKFVIYGDWVGSRIPVEKKHIMADTNIVYAIQHGIHVKMVVTDKNNLPFTAKAYVGSINDLPSRAVNASAINGLTDTTGHYILGTAP